MLAPTRPRRAARSQGRSPVRSRLAGHCYLLPLPAQGGRDPRERPAAAHGRGEGCTQQPHGKHRTSTKVPRLRVRSATRTAAGAFKVTPATRAGGALPGRRTRGGAEGKEGGASGPQSRAAPSADRAPSAGLEEKVQSLCGSNQAFAYSQKDASL